jgi:signal transduction histidine kinase
MSADQLIQYLTSAVFFLIFVITVVQAVRHPRRANVDIALLFSGPALIIAIGLAAASGLVRPGPLPNAVNTSLILAMGHLLLRLVDDFTEVHTWLLRTSSGLLALMIVAAFVLLSSRPGWLMLLMLIYLIGLLIFAAVAFFRQSRRTSGVTRRRMWAAALGCALLGLTLVLVSLIGLIPSSRDLLLGLSHVAGLASGASYYLGFVTPRWLRRAWQEPELRAFLGTAASLPRLPDTATIVRELEQGAASSIGAPHAIIGLWDEAEQVLRFEFPGRQITVPLAEETFGAQVFRAQQARFGVNINYSNPAYVEISRTYRVNALLAAPISAGAKRLGVLTVYSDRAPIFADDDLALVQLLADQAAVILESRALIDEAARVQAREEATRLKDDFLSAAAHDLKTPLTTLIARAQLLERRTLRAPDAPADLASIQVLLREGQRLKRLVVDLLDAARTEQGRLVGERSSVDLVALARDVCERLGTEQHRCLVVAEASVVGMYDEIRIHQLLENLVENALKYSPDGGAVQVKVWREDEQARLAVTDSGIGIPPEDLPHVFERFYRAGNVDDRRFAGMGLGLFICHGIVVQHGGQIWATSQPGRGSTFHVSLPLVRMEATVYA